ncbi:MAG: hypothetical protein K6G73_11875 [Marinilabiliaceae bacterium]|nr:hypothetical protein [Marinilabiliaceae bacterium]
MKKTETILLIASAALALLKLLIVEIPGIGILLSLFLSTTGLFYYALTRYLALGLDTPKLFDALRYRCGVKDAVSEDFKAVADKERPAKAVFAINIISYTLCFAYVSLLFNLMHFPGASILLSATILLVLASFVVVLLCRDESEMRSFMYSRMLLILGLHMIVLFLPNVIDEM